MRVVLRQVSIVSTLSLCTSSPGTHSYLLVAPRPICGVHTALYHAGAFDGMATRPKLLDDIVAAVHRSRFPNRSVK